MTFSQSSALLAKLTSTFVLSMALIASWTPGLQAHEVRPAVADIEVSASKVSLALRMTLEPILAGIDLAGLENTNDSPLSGLNDQFRAMDPVELETQLRESWLGVDARISLLAGDIDLPLTITGITVPEVGDVELPRDSTLILEAALPDDGSALRFGWDAGLGPLIVRQVGGGADAYTAILNNGELSAPLPRSEVATDTAGQVFVRYTISGFEHIIPKGLDHILFVLGLFFFSLRLSPLLWQVSAFTLAHTVTLALASLGIVTLPASIVEPLIAASIAFVAIENLRGGDHRSIGWSRIAVVFGFGLLHGLGFASVLGDVGLQAGRFVVGLIGFNIGVELGQLAVILAAYLLLGLPFGKRDWYRGVIAIPGSLVIASIGLWWTYERVFLG